jgi:hypothetical protein
VEPGQSEPRLIRTETSKQLKRSPQKKEASKNYEFNLIILLPCSKHEFLRNIIFCVNVPTSPGGAKFNSITACPKPGVYPNVRGFLLIDWDHLGEGGWYGFQKSGLTSINSSFPAGPQNSVVGLHFAMEAAVRPSGKVRRMSGVPIHFAMEAGVPIIFKRSPPLGPHRKHRYVVLCILRVLPSNGSCLQSHCLARSLCATVSCHLRSPQEHIS